METYFIHVGYPKTATTFLQEELFRNIKEINFIGKSNAYYPSWLINWHYWDDYSFNHNLETIRNNLLKSRKPDQPNLISSEAFIMWGGMILNQASRIKKIIPNAKIILTVRNPIDMIISYYKYLIKYYGCTSSLENVLDWERTPTVFFRRKPIYLADFLFDETIEIYQDLFGASNLCVLRFEDMLARTTDFQKKLTDFIEIKLPDNFIYNKLEKKVNVAPEKEEIYNLVYKNLKNLACKSIVNENLTLTFSKPKKEYRNVLLKKELKSKLISFFKNKTYRYY